MRLESLAIKIVAARAPFDPLPLQELRITFTDTEIFFSARENRHSGYEAIMEGGLSVEAVKSVIRQAKRKLVSNVLEITAEANFSRQFIGTEDEVPVLLHRFRYDSKLDFLTALVTLEDADSKNWQPDDEFSLSTDDFWSVGLINSLAHHIDVFGSELGFITDTKKKALQVTAFRSV
jgi:hypothetical protein